MVIPPRILGHLRKLALVGALGAVVWTWADTLKWSWASKDWAGLWSSSTELRGKSVSIGDNDVETTEERERREKKLGLGLGLAEDLRGVRRDLLGDKQVTRGNAVRGTRAELPEGHGDYTQREACFLQKMEFPERFKDLDCMADKYDDNESWMSAPAYHGPSEDKQ